MIDARIEFAWPLSLCVLALIPGCSSSDAIPPVVAATPIASAVTARSNWNPVFLALDGRELQPAAEPAHQAIALVFILPDCPICNAYLPELNRLHDAFSTRGVSLLLVHADDATTTEKARDHAREYQIKPPVILDPRRQWVKKAGATIAPQAAVFSPSGELLYLGRVDNQYAGLGKRRAAVTEHDLRDALDAILAGQSIKEPQTEAIGCLIPDLSRGK
jgi:AhpC/TSA family